ncbi:hypothetical protein [Halomonas alkaliantarctica]|uniref:hypothetical protein n=1 Tax=Halomonas alkaliantarctica TaxID=232346 RepID=UPI00068974B2|nr:hypothetical protein [Halomonas alkaliantarctica]
MKKKVYYLDEMQTKFLFSPIRNKKDLIDVLLQAVKVMLIGNDAPEDKAVSKMVLVVDKMSRLFFCSDEKIFSINFPFLVDLSKDGSACFYSKQGFPVDSRATSLFMSVFNEHIYGVSDVEEFAYSVIDVNEEYSGQLNDFWIFFKEVVLFEDGYLRFDYDTERQDERLHPLSHVDVYYSNSNTFKIGLYSRIDFDGFFDIINVGSEVYYMSPFKS